MDQIIAFLGQEWQLTSAFAVLSVALVLVLWRERAAGASRVDPQQATRLMNKEQALVIDLRDNNAFSQGHIVGAKNIPHTRLSQEIADLAKYKSKPVILICDLGRNSASSGTLMRKQGFEKVVMLSGGIQAWRAAGLPLTSGK